MNSWLSDAAIFHGLRTAGRRERIALYGKGLPQLFVVIPLEMPISMLHKSRINGGFYVFKGYLDLDRRRVCGVRLMRHRV